jgi:hypothetical protein
VQTQLPFLLSEMDNAFRHGHTNLCEEIVLAIYSSADSVIDTNPISSVNWINTLFHLSNPSE